MGLRPTDLPGIYTTGSLRPVAPHIYATDGLTESPPKSHLYAFDIGDYAYPVLEPIPHIEMTLFDFVDACVTVTVYRTIGKRVTPVRGTIRVPSAGGVNVVDWQAPFGVPITYWAKQYDIDGVFLGTTAPSTTQLDCADTWLHNPLDPAGAVRVDLGRGAGSKIPRGQDNDVVYFDGSGIPSAVTGQRHGVEGTPIVFWTLTDADSDKVNEILGDPDDEASGPMIICIRPGMHLNTRWPRPFIALVDLEEQPFNQHAGREATRWEGTATEIQEPAIALIAAVLTYEDLDATYLTYEAEDDAYGTYLEGDRDYRLAGTADPSDDPDSDDSTQLGVYGAGIYGS